MIEDKLEIVLVTYNRAPYLEFTLKKILDSPFKNCKFTIFDNCSPDETPQVCKKYKQIFSNLKVVRHNCNIGANANIVEAIRSSRSEYTWLLADDDDFDFNDCDDVIEAIETGKYDFIYLCSTIHPSNKILEDSETLNEILEEKNDITGTNKTSNREFYTDEIISYIKGAYFADLGFIPSIMFKTKHYDSDTIIKAFDNVPALFPHFAFVCKSIKENFLIYKSKKDMVIQKGIGGNNDPEHAFSMTKFYWGWLTSLLMIEDKKIRDIAFTNLTTPPNMPDYNYIFIMMAGIIIDKAYDRKDRKKYFIPLLSNIFQLTGKNVFKGLFISIMLILSYLIPKSICLKLHQPFKQKHESNIKE